MEKTVTVSRARKYLVLDCETATLPFANEICMTAKQKQNVAIAKPLIYDLGWKIVDRKGNVYSRHSFLISEIFSVPAVFNTAYYKDKRPIYLEKLKNGEITLTDWNSAVDVLLQDLEMMDVCCAFNAMFDFKKAIPFTETYIRYLYSDKYFQWEERQKQICKRIAGGDKQSNEHEFDPDHFDFRGNLYDMADIWGIACDMLINNDTYKRQCLKNKMVTNSGEFFKTSAESTFRYLASKYDFDEAHTALEDVDIEAVILQKALTKGKIPMGIIYFPFKDLGTTVDFITTAKRRVPKDHVINVIEVIKANLEQRATQSAYVIRMENQQARLQNYLEEKYQFCY